METRTGWWSIVALAIAPTSGFAQAGLEEFADRLAVLEGARPAQWRVIWTEDPAHAATVSWSTAIAGTSHRVYYDDEPHDGRLAEYAHHVDSHKNGAYTRNASDNRVPEAHYHHARLIDLEPSSKVYFAIASEGSVAPEMHFITAPDDERDLSVLYGGDSRSGLRSRCEINLMMAAMVDESPDVLAFAHGGDYIMLGSRWDHWAGWLTHHELTVADSGRALPIIPARGNHDFGPLFNEIFDWPGEDGRNYYVTELSPAAYLLTLNSEISTAGDQAVWIESTLKDLRPHARWLVATYHRPVYPAVKGPADAKAHWPPLFERYDLDLSLESDGHCIKRTVPIRNEKFDPTGVTYIGEGGLGVPQRRPRTDRWYLEPPGMAASGHHVVRLDFSEEGLRIRFVLLPQQDTSISPETYDVVVPPRASWLYLAGSDPTPDWKEPDFDASSWESGTAGFGYGHDDDVTELRMRGSYKRVYVRKSFSDTDVADAAALGLAINYDDAFVAYLNGKEICRVGMHGSGAEADDVDSHRARGHELFPIDGWRELLVPGENVIAIEGHNKLKGSKGFTLDPFVVGDRKSQAVPERELADDYTLKPRKP